VTAVAAETAAATARYEAFEANLIALQARRRVELAQAAWAAAEEDAIAATRYRVEVFDADLMELDDSD
jgi:hypothetical protein